MLFRPTILLLVMFYANLSHAAVLYTKELTAIELQEKVDANLPLEKKLLLSTVRLSDAKVHLPEGDTGRITVELSVIASTLGGLKKEGRAQVVSGISYMSEKGEFYLKDPEIVSLQIEGVPESQQDHVKMLVERAAKLALKEMPIYRFNDENLKQKLAKATLQAVRVENGKLLLDLGF